MSTKNQVILAELMQVLEDMDYFNIYPTRKSLRQYLKRSVSDSDKIRVILRDEYVQQYLYPDLPMVQDKINHDPVHYYLEFKQSNQ